jgi:hypothetical protein
LFEPIDILPWANKVQAAPQYPAIARTGESAYVHDAEKHDDCMPDPRCTASVSDQNVQKNVMAFRPMTYVGVEEEQKTWIIGY